MVFGYSSNAFVKYSLVEAIDRIRRTGFRGIEIMCDKPHLYPPDFGDAELAEVRDALERNGLKITNLNGFTLFAVGNTWLPSWIESDPERRKIRISHTLDCLGVAHRLGAECISIPPGGPLEKGMTRAQAMKLFLAGLDQVIPEAEKLGIKLLIEPEPDLLIERSSEFLELIREIRSDIVGANFDIGHFYCVGEDPAAAFEELRQWTGHVHIEDIAASRKHHHLVPGQGAIDYAEVFRAMKRLDYKGDICLELYTCTDAPEEAGKQSLEFLGPIFEQAGLDMA